MKNPEEERAARRVAEALAAQLRMMAEVSVDEGLREAAGGLLLVLAAERRPGCCAVCDWLDRVGWLC